MGALQLLTFNSDLRAKEQRSSRGIEGRFWSESSAVL